jgi:ketosteroid isomerase-like protein
MMSQENIQAFERGVEAYNRRDVGPLLEVSHPDIEWHPLTAEVEGGEAFHGHEGLREWWAKLEATFEEFTVGVEEVRDLGDLVLALGHARLRFRSGGILDTKAGYLGRFRDGLAVWAQQYPSHAQALEAAGLRE